MTKKEKELLSSFTELMIVRDNFLNQFPCFNDNLILEQTRNEKIESWIGIIGAITIIVVITVLFTIQYK